MYSAELSLFSNAFEQREEPLLCARMRIFYLFLFKYVLSEHEGCPLEILQVRDFLISENIITEEKWNQQRELYSKNKSYWSKFVRVGTQLFSRVYRAIYEEKLFWNMEMELFYFRQKDSEKYKKGKVTKLLSDPFSAKFHHFCLAKTRRKSQRLSDYCDIDNEKFTVSKNDDFSDLVPIVPTRTPSLESISPSLNMFTKTETPAITIDRTRSACGQLRHKSFNPIMLNYLFMNKLNGERTRSLLRQLAVQIDSNPSLSEFRTEENDRITYSIPGRTFTDSIVDGFEYLLQAQRAEFLEKSLFVTLALDGTTTRRNIKLTSLSLIDEEGNNIHLSFMHNKARWLVKGKSHSEIRNSHLE